MPSYEFICNCCNQTFTRVSSIDNRHIPISEPCPNCGETGSVQRYYGNQHYELSDPWRLGHKKPDREWREFLGRMESANPGSSINSQL